MFSIVSVSGGMLKLCIEDNAVQLLKVSIKDVTVLGIIKFLGISVKLIQFLKTPI